VRVPEPSKWQSSHLISQRWPSVEIFALTQYTVHHHRQVISQLAIEGNSRKATRGRQLAVEHATLVLRTCPLHTTTCHNGEAYCTRRFSRLGLVFLDPRDCHAPGETLRASRDAAPADRVYFGACDGVYRHGIDFLVLIIRSGIHHRPSPSSLHCKCEGLGLGRQQSAFGRDLQRANSKCEWNLDIESAHTDRLQLATISVAFLVVAQGCFKATDVLVVYHLGHNDGTTFRHYVWPLGVLDLLWTFGSSLAVLLSCSDPWGSRSSPCRSLVLTRSGKFLGRRLTLHHSTRDGSASSRVESAVTFWS